MPANSNREDVIAQLSQDIENDVGIVSSHDIDQVSDLFDKTIASAVNNFHSSIFDSDGFIKKMSEMRIDKQDQEMMKTVLNSIKNDYRGFDLANQSDLMLRRDIYNICIQMPEMHDVIQVVRDSIIECNVATGEVSRSISFDTEDKNKSVTLESQVTELEKQHNLFMAIKNFIVPNTLMHGEMYINVVPYSKLFAELDYISKNGNMGGHSKVSWGPGTHFHESVPPEINEYFQESHSLNNDENAKALFEAVSVSSKISVKSEKDVEENKTSSYKYAFKDDNEVKADIHSLLENIEVYNGSSVLFGETGTEGLREFLKKSCVRSKEKKDLFRQFNEDANVMNGTYGSLDPDDVDEAQYKDISGCYIKYLDSLRIIPIAVDNTVNCGYYYSTTTMDLNANPTTTNGIVDLSYQTYTKDKKMVSQLAEIIIRNFDKPMLQKNIKLKNEIAAIVEAHKFSEGKLSFIYIPEDEIVRLVINQDENGKGHSILEPTLFPARLYLMLTLYNTLYTLNNNTTRVHYLKSSGLNKDYASQIQRTMRKFQARRVSVDDIYSYTGVMNKLGGMGEMVLPAGRSDYKALETDTIPAVENPISMEFLEQQRRQAISGTGVPNMLVINAIDEVDFAKTLELANTRYLSTISAYKIDFNEGLTRFYRKILKYSTDMDEDEILSFRFQFNAVKQQELVINADMINNFNSTVELEESLCFAKNELIDDNGNPTELMMEFRKNRARKYLPQLDIDELEKVASDIRQHANEKKAENIGDKGQNIEENDLKEVE